jgi:hypothetical protein
MKWEVSHFDRDIEFINQKQTVDSFIRSEWNEQNLGKASCEMLANKLLKKFNATFVSVFEDGENGAEVYYA